MNRFELILSSERSVMPTTGQTHISGLSSDGSLRRTYSYDPG